MSTHSQLLSLPLELLLTITPYLDTTALYNLLATNSRLSIVLAQSIPHQLKTSHILHAAVRADNLSLLSLLLPHIPHTSDASHRSPLHYASPACASLILTHTPSAINTPGPIPTPLTTAAASSSNTLLTTLLNSAANATTLSTALHAAITASNLSSVTLLLAAGADARTPDAYGTTPLIAAAKAGSVPVLRRLLRTKGTRVDERDWSGWSGVMWAVWGGHMACARALVEAGAEVDGFEDAPEGWGVQPLAETVAAVGAEVAVMA
ncbi:ankyrin repeat-containing domain protein [Geopyxis carbonaria]|nr:ankyrin repeat-containing domain protein [Geopyxis carbonaria]